MSSFRLLSLLVAVLAVCACLLPSSVVGHPVDPTTACTAASGDSSYGDWVSDTGYSQLWGLNSTYSSAYSVMCAWQGMYGFDPYGNNNVWGPWHGNPNDPNCDVSGQTYFDSIEWPVTGYGTVASRINADSGKRVLTSFKLGTSCDSTNICAGGCPGFSDSADYAKSQSDLEADPTYEVTYFNSSTDTDSTQVWTNLNSTGATVNVKSTSGIYPVVPVSVISSVQYCYGYVDQPCPANNNQ